MGASSHVFEKRETTNVNQLGCHSGQSSLVRPMNAVHGESVAKSLLLGHSKYGTNFREIALVLELQRQLFPLRDERRKLFPQ